MLLLLCIAAHILDTLYLGYNLRILISENFLSKKHLHLSKGRGNSGSGSTRAPPIPAVPAAYANGPPTSCPDEYDGDPLPTLKK